MSGTSVLLNGPRYVLGESELDHTALPDLAGRAGQLGLAPVPELWGWGTYRRTVRTIGKLATDAGAAVMDAAGIAPSAVDALVLCSIRFPGGAETHAGFVADVMSALEMPNAAFTGLTLNACGNLLAGIGLAAALVASEHRRCVLVLTTDRQEDETRRLTKFALFSDGAAGCVVAADGYGEDHYEVIACAAAHDNLHLDWSNQLSSDLSRIVTQQVLESIGGTVGDIDGLLHPNQFKPIVVMKEHQAGFMPEQLYMANIPRVGHCFAADPLINLVDRAEAGDLRDGGLYLLAASVPGARQGVLLRRVTAGHRPPSGP